MIIHALEQTRYSREWRKWYAWYPVNTIEGSLVWLTYVWYRWDKSGYDPGFEYSIVGANV